MFFSAGAVEIYLQENVRAIFKNCSNAEELAYFFDTHCYCYARISDDFWVNNTKYSLCSCRVHLSISSQAAARRHDAFTLQDYSADLITATVTVSFCIQYKFKALALNMWSFYFCNFISYGCKKLS